MKLLTYKVHTARGWELGVREIRVEELRERHGQFVKYLTDEGASFEIPEDWIISVDDIK